MFSEIGFLFDLKLKKQACVNVAPGPAPPVVADGVAAVARRVVAAPKPVQKKVTAKPKPVEVIEVSSEEKDNEEKSVHKKKEEVHSKKKPSRTLSSVLTARSKVCLLYCYLLRINLTKKHVMLLD